jgi:uncharacterized protein YpmB
MKMLKYIKKYLNVIFVVILSFIISVFLSCTNKIKNNKEKSRRQKTDDVKQKDPTDKKGIDVEETKKGQPVNRNLLE